MLLLGSLASASGCGGVATDQAVCEADETRECQANRRCIGVQTCIDGLGWGECLCAGNPAQGGSGGSGASNFGGTSNQGGSQGFGGSQGGGPPSRGGTTGDASTSRGGNPSTGGTPATGGGPSTGGSGGVIGRCNQVRCEPRSIYLDGTPFLEFPACCDDNSCGIDVTPAAELILISGCRELARPGRASAQCPDVVLDILGTPTNHPGCCDNRGQCGVVVDMNETLILLGATGPNLGCQPREAVGEQPIRCN